MSKLINKRIELKEVKAQIRIQEIIENERCNICEEPTNQKCLLCLLDNRLAGYCLEHHQTDNFNRHEPIWISAFE
jgi:hypothetical protein